MRSRVLWVCGGGVVAAAVTALIALYEMRDTTSRLLVASPDGIIADATLMRYSVPRGRAAYAIHCAGCHGIALHGDPARGIPDLVDSDWLYGSGRVGEIEQIVRYGIRSGNSRTQNLASMPAFATATPYSRYQIETLSADEVNDVTGLVYSFQHPAAVDPATVARGTAIYQGKGLCFDCHTGRGTGDPAIGAPNLKDDIWLYGDGSFNHIHLSIAHGRAGYCPAWSGRLPPATIRTIAVYVHLMAAPAAAHGTG